MSGIISGKGCIPQSDGSLIVEVSERGNYREREEKKPTNEWTRDPGTLVWVDTSFKTYRRLGPRGGIQQIKVNVAGNPEYFVGPTSIRGHQAVAGSPPRICIDGMSGPQVDCYDSDGSATLIRWRSAPQPVTAETMAQWKEVEARSGGSHGSAAQVRAALANVPHPGERAHVVSLSVDALRMVWVLSPDLRADSGEMRYRLFDAGGQLVGIASVTPGRIVEIGADYLIVVQSNADGVERVVVQGLVRSVVGSR